MIPEKEKKNIEPSGSGSAQSSVILFFGYDHFSDRMKAASLQKALSTQGYYCEQIEKELYHHTIGELVAGAGRAGQTQPDTDQNQKENPAPMSLPGRFILFAGMQGEQLHTALKLCEGEIRAILTPSNSQMRVDELCRHLVAERESLQKH